MLKELKKIKNERKEGKVTLDAPFIQVFTTTQSSGKHGRCNFPGDERTRRYDPSRPTSSVTITAGKLTVSGGRYVTAAVVR